MVELTAKMRKMSGKMMKMSRILSVLESGHPGTSNLWSPLIYMYARNLLKLPEPEPMPKPPQYEILQLLKRKRDMKFLPILRCKQFVLKIFGMTQIGGGGVLPY